MPGAEDFASFFDPGTGVLLWKSVPGVGILTRKKLVGRGGGGGGGGGGGNGSRSNWYLHYFSEFNFYLL